MAGVAELAVPLEVDVGERRGLGEREVVPDPTGGTAVRRLMERQVVSGFPHGRDVILSALTSVSENVEGGQDAAWVSAKERFCSHSSWWSL